MEPTSKFFGKSLTLWGVVVAALCSFIHNRTGVNLTDEVQPTQDAVTAIVNGLVALAPSIGQLVGVIMVIVGRFRAQGPLHVIAPPTLPPNSPLAKAGAIAAAVVILSLSLGLSGCGSNGGLSAPAGGETSSAAVPTTTTAQKVSTVLLTAANVLQQLNTGLQTAAPTAEVVLAMLHNQGDAQLLANDAATATAVNAGVQALVANVNAAVTVANSSSATPALQQAAVNAALNPATVAAIIAPIQAATSK